MAAQAVPTNLADANAFMAKYEADLRVWVRDEPVADVAARKAAEQRFFGTTVRFHLV